MLKSRASIQCKNETGISKNHPGAAPTVSKPASYRNMKQGEVSK